MTASTRGSTVIICLLCRQTPIPRRRACVKQPDRMRGGGSSRRVPSGWLQPQPCGASILRYVERGAERVITPSVPYPAPHSHPLTNSTVFLLPLLLHRWRHIEHAGRWIGTEIQGFGSCPRRWVDGVLGIPYRPPPSWQSVFFLLAYLASCILHHSRVVLFPTLTLAFQPSARRAARAAVHRSEYRPICIERGCIARVFLVVPWGPYIAITGGEFHLLRFAAWWCCW